MPEFDSNGIRLHYVLAGPDDGRPILLVHGFCSDYELNWVGTRWQQTLTDAGFLILGLDCRGHGHSEKPHDPAAYDRVQMALDAINLLDHLDIADADYLGYSMGARIGLHVCLEHGSRVGRAVLGGSGLPSGPGRADLIAARLRGDESVTDEGAVMFYTFAAARPINDLEALACCILGPHEAITEEQLASIKLPIAVAAGDADPIASTAPELAKALGSGRYHALPGRNHMNAVPARQFKDAALEFLAER
jgi:pimeloyl-ACP methyl ester carboxylesterase